MTNPPNLVSEKLHGLDHLRALAIALVFFSHYPSDEFPDKVLAIKNFGWIGVDLFFVLSGFLIAKQLFTELKNRHTISLKHFYVKRFFRIMPVYFVVLAIYFLVPPFRERESLAPFWKFISFTQNIGLDPGVNGTFSHAWSLCVEEQFYLLFPLLLLTCAHFKKTTWGIYILVAFFLFTCISRLFIWEVYMQPLINQGKGDGNFWVTWLYYPTYTRLDGLLTGIAIAGIVTYYPVLAGKFYRFANLILFTGILLLAAAYFICLERRSFNANIFGFPLLALSFGCMVLAAISPRCILYKIRSSITSSIAILSYAVYLIHKAITHLCVEYFEKMGVDEDSLLMLALAIVFSLLGAVILRYAIEKPFLKWRDAYLHKQVNPV